MTDTVDLWQRPTAQRMVMIAGWRQWADAGSISSRLPKYIKSQMEGRKIGELHLDDCYLFQIPGTHDLVRPVVQLEEGYPAAYEQRKNELFYVEAGDTGVVLFLGDEPHLRVERYAEALFEAARQLGVTRIVSLGGVYAEVPYDRERPVSAIYSLKRIQAELSNYAVSLSNYQGGSSIGSTMCYLAAQAGLEYVGFFAFVPTYDFSHVAPSLQGVRVENDFVAWRGLIRRISYMLNFSFNFNDLDRRCDKLIKTLDEKAEELAHMAPDLGLRNYFERLSADFEEVEFLPLDDVWEEELRNLFDKLDD